MYPKNAASPPRISIGAVVQISDGAVQTSGVSIVVRPEGGSESAGGGTTSYGASSGIVYYKPTQSETNYTAFVVTAYKTGCVPISQTIITTSSATSGTVVLSAVTHTGAVIPTVSTVSNAVTLPSIPAGWVTAAGIAAGALDGKGDWNTIAPDNATIAAIAGYVDTEITNILSRLPAALVGGRMDSNMSAINNNNEAALDLEASASTIRRGTAAVGTLSTTEMTTDLTISVDGQLNGKVLIFKADTTTAALRDQATDITESLITGGKLTFTALTTAPASTDTFVVV